MDCSECDPYYADFGNFYEDDFIMSQFDDGYKLKLLSKRAWIKLSIAV